MIVTDHLNALAQRLKEGGATFRGEISDGGAGKVLLLEDPSDNIIELFEFKKPQRNR